MFGWEFPPYSSGGLGMACFGIVRSLLRSGHQVSLVLPRSIGKSSTPGFSVIGTDVWENHLAKEEQLANSANLQTFYLDADLQPYSSVTSPLTVSVLGQTTLNALHAEQDQLEAPTSNTVYGPDLFYQVEKYARLAASIAATLEFDLIHCHDWMTFSAGIVAKQVSGKPLLCHVHATEFDRAPGHGSEHVSRLERNGCEVADRVIAVSNYTKEILAKHYGIIKDKIDVVHNGIEMQAGNSPANPLEVTHEDPLTPERQNPRVLFLGRITYQKGPNYFLEAAHKVLQIRPEIRFIIAGAGDMLEYLRGRSHELGMANRVKFMGLLSEEKVQEVYRSVDCFVLSSVSEPFGLTVLEALSHRLPVIISKQSGVSEVLKHVLRYDYWDVERLASLILSVVSYKPLSDELKEHAVEDISPITWDQAASKITDIYHRVCQY